MSKRLTEDCWFCGEPLGFAADPDDMETCQKKECQREARYQRASEDADARDRAEKDDYGAYR